MLGGIRKVHEERLVFILDSEDGNLGFHLSSVMDFAGISWGK